MLRHTVSRFPRTMRFYSTSGFRPWRQLEDPEKKQFIGEFIELYTSQNKRTKNYYKQLAAGMDEHDDIPSVFGLLYNDLIEKQANDEVEGEFGKDYFDLLKK